MNTKKSDPNRDEFEAWLSSELKQPLSAGDHFVEQLVSRLEKQRTDPSLRRFLVQKRIYESAAGLLGLGGLSTLLYPTVSAEIAALINGLFGGLIRMASQPSVESFAIPAAVVLVGAVVLWNLTEMLSLE